MKKIIAISGLLFLGIISFFAITAFVISDPKADFVQERIRLDEPIVLSELNTENATSGAFKALVRFKHRPAREEAKAFYGQQIHIADNPNVDRILIGVTNNLISRVELWKEDQLVATNEVGFMGKMSWGATQSMSVAFFDETNEKRKGQSKIIMRFYEHTGFFGDIGTINLDLTEYGKFSGAKTIAVFAKGLDSDLLSRPKFSDLQIWKQYRSFD